MRKSLVTFLAIAALSLVNATLAQAAPIAIINDDSGWYAENGVHGDVFLVGNDPLNTNYIAGRDAGIQYHDFFVFDLSAVSGTVTSATLELFTADISSNGVYKNFDVTTSIASLVAGTGGTAAFTDLNDGSAFGAIFVTTAQSNTVISITLNAAAIAAIQGSLGGMFAIGGNYLGDGPFADYTFGFSGDFDGDVDVRNRLILDGVSTSVPDGGLTISLLGGALMALGALRRKFNQ